jgi:hypothetical protein
MKTFITMTLFLSAVSLFLDSSFSRSAFANENNKRQKELNFEDDVIEGINRKPLDSVNQISERDDHEKPHLYRKRATFSDLNLELSDNLRLQP